MKAIVSNTTARIVSVVLVLLAVSVVAAGAATTIQPLVSAEWLKAHVGQVGLVVIDIRPKQDFEAGHVPGAVNGEYPDLWRQADWALPPLETLNRNLSALGIGDSTMAVIVSAGTDGTELGGATFAYWVLKYLGHKDVTILDGGWTAWHTDPTDPVQSGASVPTPAQFVEDLQPELRATTQEVIQQLGTDTVLIDARSPDQYVGKTKSDLVSRAGRIPGAINLPFSAFYDEAAHRLKPTAALASLLPPTLTGRGTKVIAYCNTGHWSSIDWFVLHELLGYRNTRLYDGSMAAWTRDPRHPVQTGELPQ